jgi:hypothetical protein
MKHLLTLRGTNKSNKTTKVGLFGPRGSKTGIQRTNVCVFFGLRGNKGVKKGQR